MALTIKRANLCDGVDVYELLQTLPADENGFVNSMAGKSYQDFQAWLQGVVANAQQKGIVDGWKVPQSTYWLYLDGDPIGYGKIRHFLTDQLKESGGHMGIAIHPQMRGRGYGTFFIAGLIDESRKLGIKELLFTIKNQNVASIQAVIANGGIVEKITDERHYLSIKL